jgi:hypothetical protein
LVAAFGDGLACPLNAGSFSCSFNAGNSSSEVGFGFAFRRQEKGRLRRSGA